MVGNEETLYEPFWKSAEYYRLETNYGAWAKPSIMSEGASLKLSFRGARSQSVIARSKQQSKLIVEEIASPRSLS